MHDNDSSVDLSEPWLYRLQDSSHGFTEMIEQIMALAEVRLKNSTSAAVKPCLRRN